MKSFMNEFKEFAMRGNVLDMAIGIIIGGAFTAIVTALVDNIISPLIGMLIAVDFNHLAVTVNGVELLYGAFIMAVVKFIIVAFVLFCLIKAMNKAASLAKKEEPAEEEAPTTKECPFCKTEIHIDATRCPHCTSIIEE
ncbi:MAG: large conductance mechanosensitive channel protein MscL [Eubacterium sp.]|nr:large conductance mechanosensitive channel protein MscL [Candidatus Colimonas fimequi]